MLLIPLTIRGVLDAFITRNDLPNPDLFVHAPSISDHSLIEGHSPIQPENVFETFTTRSWRKFDETKFKQDLFASNFFSQDSNWANFTIDELFSDYNFTLRTLLDKHLRGSSLLQEIAKSVGKPWQTGWQTSLCARRQIARSLMGLLRRLFPGNVRTNCRLDSGICRLVLRLSRDT